MTQTPRNERRLLGGAVRRIREAKALTLDELATKAEIHFAYLSNLERGKKAASEAAIARIANGLGVDVDDISYHAVVYQIIDGETAA